MNKKDPFIFGGVVSMVFALVCLTLLKFSSFVKNNDILRYIVVFAMIASAIVCFVFSILSLIWAIINR